MKQKSIIGSILNQKCPKCRDGQLFKSGNYNIFSFTVMHKACNRCNQSFEPEPGFYTGAMYVSYAIQVIILIGVGLGMYVLGKERGVLEFLSWVTGINLILFPLIYRLSRSIWIHLTVTYQNSLEI